MMLARYLKVAAILIVILLPLNLYANYKSSNASNDAKIAKTTAYNLCVHANSNRRIGNRRAYVLKYLLKQEFQRGNISLAAYVKLDNKIQLSTLDTCIK